MLDLQTLHAEIVRRIIKLDERNRASRLSYEDTQHLRGQIAALVELSKWNPEADEDKPQPQPEEELHFGLTGEPMGNA